MPFLKIVISKLSWKRYWKKLRCDECGLAFQVGEKVYSQFKGGINTTVKAHLCEVCYNAKFVDV